jgi:membrane protein DedA with SNARE-associated domain
MLDAVAKITVGALMTVLCGGCTAWYAVVLVDSWVGGHDVYVLPAAFVGMLIVGVLPTVVGILLLWVGLKRRSRKP